MKPLRAAAVLAIVLASVQFVSLNTGTWLISPDSTDYVEGARSLAQLQGYVDANDRPQTLVPPGTSAIYAFAALVPAVDFFYYNLLTKLLAIAFVALAYLVVRHAAGDAAALVVVLFLAFNERLLFESTRILSDIPGSAVFMATLWIFPQDRLEALSARGALALGGLLAACYLVRPVGLLVFVGYAAYIVTAVRTNRLRTVVLMSALFAAVVLALWVRAQVAGGASYSYWQLIFLRRAWVADSGFPGLMDWYQRITANGAQTARLVSAALSNDAGPSAAALVVVLLMLVGVATQLATRRFSLPVFLLASYLPGLLMPPAGPEPRYLLPILPLLGVLAAYGASVISARLPGERARSAARLALAVLIAIGALPYWTHGYEFASSMRTELQRDGRPIMYRGHNLFVELVEQQRGTLRPTDVVATMHANVLRYFLPLGVRVSNIPLIENVDAAHRKLRDIGTTVIYADKTVESWRYLEPVIRADPSSFELEADNREAAIYRVRATQTSVR